MRHFSSTAPSSLLLTIIPFHHVFSYEEIISL